MKWIFLFFVFFNSALVIANDSKLGDLMFLPRSKQQVLSLSHEFSSEKYDDKDINASDWGKDSFKVNENITNLNYSYSFSDYFLVGAKVGYGSSVTKNTGYSDSSNSPVNLDVDHKDSSLTDPSLSTVYRILTNEKDGLNLDLKFDWNIGLSKAKRSNSYDSDGDVNETNDKASPKGNLNNGAHNLKLGVSAGKKIDTKIEFVGSVFFDRQLERKLTMLKSDTNNNDLAMTEKAKSIIGLSFDAQFNLNEHLLLAAGTWFTKNPTSKVSYTDDGDKVSSSSKSYNSYGLKLVPKYLISSNMLFSILAAYEKNSNYSTSYNVNGADVQGVSLDTSENNTKTFGASFSYLF